MKTSLPLTLVLSVLLASSFSATATTIRVPADEPTIQAGLGAAAAGDTVLVACDTYYEHDILMKSGVFLLSETMEADCATIDAQRLGRVFICDSVDSLTTIAGFTITGGLAAGPQPDDCGGGMYCFNCSPTLLDVKFEANLATSGGGLCCYCCASPTLNACAFEGNVAEEDGGGMYCYYYSCPTLTDCGFTQNEATYIHGGGAYCGSYSSAAFTRCEFAQNYAGGRVAGMHDQYASPTLTDCTFDHNVLAMGGFGGGYSCISSAAILTRCTISGHDATQGGGMFCEGGAPTLRACTFMDNEAGEGGGINATPPPRCSCAVCSSGTPASAAVPCTAVWAPPRCATARSRKTKLPAEVAARGSRPTATHPRHSRTASWPSAQAVRPCAASCRARSNSPAATSTETRGATGQTASPPSPAWTGTCARTRSSAKT